MLSQARISVAPELYLMSLPAYDANEQVSELLSMATILTRTRDYFWRGIVVPGQFRSINPLQTIEDQIQIESGSYLTGINGWSESPEGFEFQLYDQEHNINLIHGRFGKDFITGQMSGDEPFGQNWIIGPLPLGSQIIASLTNLSTSPSRIQLLLSFAVPSTPKSTAQTVVKKR